MTEDMRTNFKYVKVCHKRKGNNLILFKFSGLSVAVKIQAGY